jgi:hypothetical protein
MTENSSGRSGTSSTRTTTTNPNPNTDSVGTAAVSTKTSNFRGLLRITGSDDLPLNLKLRDLYSMNNEKGGADGRNHVDGSKWREHVDKTHYCRTKRVVQAIQKLAKDGGMSDVRAMEQLQPLW